MNRVSVDCPAKVNLFLRVLAREDSGHHQIETLFLAVGLYDRVTAEPGRPGVALRIEGPPARSPGSSARPRASTPPPGLGPPEDNTVHRAALAFCDAADIQPAVALTLAKRIPPGTGLGGGSSDAAATLVALNRLHGEPLARRDLLRIGGTIGSDVPFFCSGATAAWAWGRGDRLLPVRPPGPAWVAIAAPRERTSTAAAYAALSPGLALPARPSVLPDLAREGWDAVARIRRNDFEADAFRRIPALAEAAAAMTAAGAVLAGLTGSGSAVFGLFSSQRAASAAAEQAGSLAEIAEAVAAPALKGPWAPARGPLSAADCRRADEV